LVDFFLGIDMITAHDTHPFNDPSAHAA